MEACIAARRFWADAGAMVGATGLLVGSEGSIRGIGSEGATGGRIGCGGVWAPMFAARLKTIPAMQTAKSEQRNAADFRNDVPGRQFIATHPLLLKADSASNISWRKGWDSNPRNGSPFTAFPVLPVKPLLHLSPEE